MTEILARPQSANAGVPMMAAGSLHAGSGEQTMGSTGTGRCDDHRSIGLTTAGTQSE